jgi:HEAT repeat protein
LVATFILAGLSSCGPQIDVLDLLDKTRSGDPEIAMRARDTLDRYVLERRVGLFARALDSGDPDHRGMALWCLGRIGTPEAIAVLSEQLAADRSFPLSLDLMTGTFRMQPGDSRLQVARMLRRLGPPAGAVEIIIPSLRDEEEEDRLVAVYALAMLMDPSGAPHLLPMIEDPVDRIARAAVEALGNLRNPVAINALVASAVDPEAPTRRTALTALQRFDDPDILGPVLEAFSGEQDPEILYLMASLLGRFSDPRVVAALIPVLESNDHNLRRVAESRLCELTHRPPGLPADDWSRWWREQGAAFEFPP